MNNIFFTSDHHFGHKLMLQYRPFADIYEMDAILIEKWNSVVGEKDTIYYLGDFSWRQWSETVKILKKLNGKIIYIEGNHDKPIKQIMTRKASHKIIEFHPSFYELKYDKRHIVMSHYCFKTWNKSHWGSYHLYGHSHGNLIDNSGKKRHDVGVDNNNLLPVSIEEIDEIMKTKETVKYD